MFRIERGLCGIGGEGGGEGDGEEEEDSAWRTIREDRSGGTTRRAVRGPRLECMRWSMSIGYEYHDQRGRQNLTGRRNEEEKYNELVEVEGEEEEEEEEEADEEACLLLLNNKMDPILLHFLVSFFSTFTFLAALTYFVSQKLAEADYDISRLILIGLDRNQPTMTAVNTAYTQFIALALAIASSVFIYIKFAASLYSILPALPLLTSPLQNEPRSSIQRNSSSSPSSRKSSSLPTLPCPSLPLLFPLPSLHSLSPVTVSRCLVRTTSLVYPSVNTFPSQPK